MAMTLYMSDQQFHLNSSPNSNDIKSQSQSKSWYVDFVCLLASYRFSHHLWDTSQRRHCRKSCVKFHVPRTKYGPFMTYLRRGFLHCSWSARENGSSCKTVKTPWFFSSNLGFVLSPLLPKDRRNETFLNDYSRYRYIYTWSGCSHHLQTACKGLQTIQKKREEQILSSFQLQFTSSCHSQETGTKDLPCSKHHYWDQHITDLSWNEAEK